ncbi:MAG: PAS domain-containing protein, partial [Paludibacter sp.]
MNNWQDERNKIIGLGENSFRKSYYPELQDKIDDLELSAHNLQSILDSMNDAVIIHDNTGKMLYLNAHAFKLFGISEIELSTISFSDISSLKMNMDDLSTIWHEISICKTKTINWIARQIRSQIEFPVQVSLNHFYWYGNSAILVVIRDFTERIKFEEALITAKEKAEERERMFSDMAINSPGVIYQFHVQNDGSIVYTYVSPNVSDNFGIPENTSLLEWSLERDLYPEDSDCFLELFKKSIDEIKPFKFEGRFVSSNGIKRFMVLARPTINGSTIIYNGIITDISERKQTEEELRISELRYSSLFENIETGIVVHGPDTKVLLSNSKASELLGLSPQQMKGKVAIDPDWNFINENNEVLALKDFPVNRVVREKTVLKSQVLGICQPKTSDIVWVSVNGFPLMNKLGEITEIVISFNDITERKLAEESLKQSEEKYRMLSENFAGGISIYEDKKVK